MFLTVEVTIKPVVFQESVSWRYRFKGLGSGSSSISTALRPTALNTDNLQQCLNVRTRGMRIASHCSRYLFQRDEKKKNLVHIKIFFSFQNETTKSQCIKEIGFELATDLLSFAAPPSDHVMRCHRNLSSVMRRLR